MEQQPSAAAYLAEAERLFHGRLPPENLPHQAAQLPPLDRSLLEYLAGHAAQLALTQPKHSWAVTAVAEAAAHTHDLFLQGLAAWHVARAANAWVRPQLVEAAITRARAAFVQLDEPGWLAACDWQQNALPWTRPNFKDAAATLTNALHSLEAAGFDHLLPDCRLSLAYAHLLIGNFDQAKELTEASEQIYQAQNDQLGLGRCLLTHASRLRRQSHFAKAQNCLEQAMAQFQSTPADVLTAQVYFQLAYVAYLSQDRFAVAEARFDQALALFKMADLPLWSAQCYAALAQLYNETGRLREAGQALRQAREIYASDEIVGLRADALLDSGRLEMLKGNYAASLAYFAQAKILYEQTGNEWLPTICLSNQGQVCFRWGSYQQSLHFLELAYSRLQVLNIPYRTAACEKHLAYCWLKLGQFHLAHRFLEKAATHYKLTQSGKYLYEIYNLRAATLYYENKDREAIACLQESLSMAQQENAANEAALSRRLLGELYCVVQEYDQALPHLIAAEASFAEMGLLFEQTACAIALGRYYWQTGNEAAAQTAWQRALDLSAGVLPDIDWQAQAGLAGVARDQGKQSVALTHYQEMSRAMARLRRGLWQPSLAGSFLARPLPYLDAAIHLATQQAAHSEAAHEDALQFIEESKAQTVTRRVASNLRPLNPVESMALNDVAAEINWLQEKLWPGLALTSEALPPAEAATLRQQLVEKVKAYDQLQGQLERQQWGEQPEAITLAAFNWEQFRRQANRQLGQNWLALDYYLAGDALCTVLLTPRVRRAWETAVSPPIRLALQTATRPAQTGAALPERALARLGAWLLPDWVQEKLTPATTLILSPHRQLHRLPWPALRLGKRPLAAACVPVLVPSLHSLSLMWQRPLAACPPEGAGLLLAIAEFQGGRQPLPAVNREAALLSPLLGPAGRELRDTAATWDHLRTFAGEEGLAARFTFWHIASHAFYDGLSGRFSGVALYDRDVLLDELWQLAPLPPLVTLSACSGGHSLVYTGDEHVSLTITCLAAGAQRVVSSLWPVQDESMPALMAFFYHHWHNGAGAAMALALAQRAAHQAGLPSAQWGGLQIFGLP
ncbi:MAG: CHAT domain-containing protein [Chloroflexota bacterium]|nr:CHAT domain-containing protein [Ardenticatenaceae bacterium]GIK57939.1 MAG: CHAT domain-containing protein [Chloroflexota bacterium]